MTDDLYATCRLFTGYPVARGYVKDRKTAKVVWACPHRHRSRLRTGGENAVAYAQRCADAHLKKMRREAEDAVRP